MEKPKDLFDREREWRDLADLVVEGGGISLGVVYGRRRQGKSFLLRRLAAASQGLYHQALEEHRLQALQRFADAVAAERGLGAGQLRFGDWGEALRVALSPAATTRAGAARVVVIDELPYLLSHSPELPSLMQALIDERRSDGRAAPAVLVVCGSALSIMSELLSGARALRGRARLELVLGPFDYRQARAFWNVRDPELALALHSVFGGTAGYRDLTGSAPASLRDLPAWLGKTLLNPSHALFREAEYILSEDPRLTERSLYHSVLDAISRGERTPGRIAGRVGRPDGALRHPLRLLEEAGFVVRSDDCFRSRRPLFTVADPIVRFHHVVVRPTLAWLEDRQAAKAWKQQEPSYQTQILGPHFEEIARTWTQRFASAAALGGVAATVGPAVVADRAERSSIELDVVALAADHEPRSSRKRVLVLGEAKASNAPRGVGDLARLERARALLVASGRPSAAGARLALFGRAGFDAKLTAAARRRPDVVLVDLERVYEGE